MPMEDQILKNYESFDEKMDAILLVGNNSNLMYIKKGEDIFIAHEFINSVITDNSNIIYTTTYYNVKDNKKILELKIVKTLAGGIVTYSNEDSKVQILPLSKLLNIKGNSKYYLTEQDVDTLINYNKKSIKEKIR